VAFHSDTASKPTAIQNDAKEHGVQVVRNSESRRQTTALHEIPAIGIKQIERNDHADGEECFAALNGSTSNTFCVDDVSGHPPMTTSKSPGA
jgi:hypothetical protein